MCGIAGIINLNGKCADKSDLNAMIEALKHRGPDGNGIFIDKNIGIAHVRLSIIDLSELAHQPMRYIHNNHDYWIIHNGEVYNYIELREELEKDGFIFKSTSDTEVIIASYIKWGEECVARFNGMWSFAIYDTEKKKIFISRDRFGVKPFYYYKDEEVFIFASEIKAILKVMPSLKSAHYPYLRHFLTTGALDDGEETFFEKIKQLLPAHCLTLQGKDMKIRRYWDYNDAAKEKYDYKNAAQTFLELLTDSVKLRFRSDVPVGTCLSGGLDSSAIVTLSSKMNANPIHTFSSVYVDKDCDESYFIDIVNRFNKTVPHYVYPQSENFMHILDSIIYHQDEPSAGPGLYSQWHVMQIAQDNVKVLLDGQGADELLGGYFYFFEHYFSALKNDKNKNGIIATAKRVMREYPKVKELTNMDFCGGEVEILREVIVPRFLNNLFRMPKIKLGHPEKNKSFMHVEFIESSAKNPVNRENGKKFNNNLDNASYDALTKTSIPALLHYEDRNSMAFSIESRVPFLDYRLVEFCLGLPYEDKIKEDTTKAIMRKAMSGILPDEITHRRDKKGYPTPFARWLRENIKNDVAEILFSEQTRKRKIFNNEEIEKQFNNHISGKSDASWQIWRWLTTELWFRKFID